MFHSESPSQPTHTKAGEDLLDYFTFRQHVRPPNGGVGGVDEAAGPMTSKGHGPLALRAIRTGCKVRPAKVGTARSAVPPDYAGTQPPAGFLVHARGAAMAAAAGIFTHLAMLVGAGGWMALASLALALACIPCTVRMWRAPSVRAAQMLVGMSLGMALLHGAMLFGIPVSGHSHVRFATVIVAGTTHAGLMFVAMGVDFAASMVAASWIRRRSSVPQITA